MNEPRYSYKQKVKIIKGFYKGNYATVTEYDEKTKTYTIEASLKGGEQKVIQAAEDSLREVKTLW